MAGELESAAYFQKHRSVSGKGTHIITYIYLFIYFLMHRIAKCIINVSVAITTYIQRGQ